MKKLNVLIIAPIKKFGELHIDNGYANASFGMYRVLKELERKDIINKVDVISLNSHALEYPAEIYDVGLLICHPDSLSNKESEKMKWVYQVMSACKRRVLSIVWETFPLPKRWDFLWNDTFFTDFVSPSYFVLDQIKANTNKPCYYLPHYINTEKYSAIDIEEKSREEKFNVFWIGQYTERKSLDETLIAFIKTFQDCEDVRLIIKYSFMQKLQIDMEEKIKTMITLNSSIDSFKPEIYIINDKLSTEGMIDLYKSSSVLCMPSKAEGFGLPLAEVSSMGIPCIYVEWSSCKEVMYGLTGYKVEFVLDRTYNMYGFGYDTDSYFACPKIKSLENELLDSYLFWEEDKKKYYGSVKENRDVIEYKYGFASIKNCFENIFQGVNY